MTSETILVSHEKTKLHFHDTPITATTEHVVIKLKNKQINKLSNTTGLCTVEEIYINVASSCLKSGPGSLDHQAFGCVTVLVCKSNYTLLYCDSEKYAHIHRYLQTAIIFHWVNAARNVLKKGTL